MCRPLWHRRESHGKGELRRRVTPVWYRSRPGCRSRWGRGPVAVAADEAPVLRLACVERLAGRPLAAARDPVPFARRARGDARAPFASCEPPPCCCVARLACRGRALSAPHTCPACARGARARPSPSALAAARTRERGQPLTLQQLRLVQPRVELPFDAWLAWRGAWQTVAAWPRPSVGRQADCTTRPWPPRPTLVGACRAPCSLPRQPLRRCARLSATHPPAPAPLALPPSPPRLPSSPPPPQTARVRAWPLSHQHAHTLARQHARARGARAHAALPPRARARDRVLLRQRLLPPLPRALELRPHPPRRAWLRAAPARPRAALARDAHARDDRAPPEPRAETAQRCAARRRRAARTRRATLALFALLARATSARSASSTAWTDV